MSLLDRLFRRRRPPVPLTLYRRRSCELCELMKAEIARADLGHNWELSEVDVDSNPKLEKAYGLRLPVLAIAGRVAFEGRLDAGALEREFARRAPEWDRAQELARALQERAGRGA